MRTRSWISALCAVLILCGLSPPLPAYEKVSEVVAYAEPSVVFIRAYLDADGKSQMTGSGFIIDEEGLVVTNNHVVTGAKKIVVETSKGDILTVSREVYCDADTDFAILEVNKSGLSPLPLGDSDKVIKGTAVVAIGSPRGFKNSVSGGLISGRRWLREVEMLQFDASISPGSSGGPLLDMAGQVIGITTGAKAKGQNLNFALPINCVRDLDKKYLSKYYTHRSAQQYIEYKDVQAKSYIGLDGPKARLYYDKESWTAEHSDEGVDYSHSLENHTDLNHDGKAEVHARVLIDKNREELGSLRDTRLKTFQDHEKGTEILDEADGLVNNLKVKRLDLLVPDGETDYRYTILFYCGKAYTIEVIVWTHADYYYKYEEQISDLLSGLKTE